MKIRKYPKIKNAFTIIEAIVAVAVLTVGFIGVIQIYPGIIKLNARTSDLTVASHLAEMKTEEFVAKSYSQIPINANPIALAFTDQGFEKYFWQAKITQESSDLKKMEITVLWGPNKIYNTKLITFKAE